METVYHPGYTTGYTTIQKNVRERESRKKKDLQQKDFNFLSANLLNFLPEVPIVNHEEVYLNILSNNALISTETYFPELIDRIKIYGDASVVEDNKKKAKLYCTYHVGSYRAIIGVLAKAAIDFVLIVDTNTFYKQQERIKQTVSAIWNHFGKTAFFELVDAERVDIGIILSKYLMTGVSVVVYLDGNTGVGGIYNKNDQMLRINFLAGQIFSRKGISTLSYATKSPIVPVISHYTENGNTPALMFYDAVNPESWAKDKELYCVQVTTHLYGILAENLKVYYKQWEGWLYLHKYLDFKSLDAKAATNILDDISWSDAQRISFNEEEFGIFKIEEDSYLFDKRTYKSFKINDTTLAYLCSLKAQHDTELPEASTSEYSLIRQLAKRGIIRTNG